MRPSVGYCGENRFLLQGPSSDVMEVFVSPQSEKLMHRQKLAEVSDESPESEGSSRKWTAGLTLSESVQDLQSLLKEKTETIWQRIPQAFSSRLDGSELTLTEMKSPSTVDLRGRPMHDTCHKDCRSSLLSPRMECNGLCMFLQMLVVVRKIGLTTQNLRVYGLRIVFPWTAESLSEQLLAVLLAFGSLYGGALSAFFFEQHVHGRYIRLVACPLFIVSPMVLTYGIAVSNSMDPNVNALILAVGVTWALKLWSFHHVCGDLKDALARDFPVETLCATREEFVFAEKGFPRCLRLHYFLTFMWMPAVCFQLEYPRHPRVKWFDMLKNLLGCGVCVSLMAEIVTQYTVPMLLSTFIADTMSGSASFQSSASKSLVVIFLFFIERLLKIAVPNLVIWLLMFLAYFHYFMNFLADVTRFGDRCFYLDWWNATSIGDFWRLWNIPIHNFAVRHVYKPLLRVGTPKMAACVAVFFISAVLHEYFAVLGLTPRGVVFLGMLMQIPLMYLTAKPMVSDPLVPNAVPVEPNAGEYGVLVHILFRMGGHDAGLYQKRIVRGEQPLTQLVSKTCLELYNRILIGICEADFYMSVPSLYFPRSSAIFTQQCTFSNISVQSLPAAVSMRIADPPGW